MTRYARPNTLAEAVHLLAQAGGTLLAGGTDFYPGLGDRPAMGSVIDISRIREMKGVRVTGGEIRIGGLTTWSELLASSLPRCCDALKSAAREIGGVQIQNRGTVAGNLCNASPAADSVPALIAADAVCIVVGPNGRREMAAVDMCTGPGRNSLGSGEFVLEIRLPERPARASDAYLRAIPRTEMDIAVVGCGVSLALDAGGTVTAARVSLGAVAPTALLVAEAGAALVGSKLEEAALAKLDQAAQNAAKPIADKRGTIEYRKAMAGVLARRVALIAYARAGGKA